jgi:hypothetical protein
MFTSAKKLLTVAIAAASLATGSLAVTGEALAKGKHFGGGHFHGGHHKFHGHGWHFKRHFGFYGGGYGSPCYWVHKPWGLVKVCPSYYY